MPAAHAGQVVSVRLEAERLPVVAEGRIIAEHNRHLGRDRLICDPWHYLPILEKKPGVLRHSAPFQSWELPVAIRVVRDRLLKQSEGDQASSICCCWPARSA
ncbi:Mu transposase domain-containing protein [Methylogaea oryzae]|uniref:Mu transposase domain-containing protein n=1 Tax=Methylogaea oryzae TaxID=1295382 RepID=UPI0006D2478A|nr:hypothetical protein [Methylogaea oryzae]